MAGQIELEPYEQLNKAEDQHTYEDITRDHEDQKNNSIVHEVNISWQQWTKIVMLTLIVSIVSACIVLIVCYFSMFAKLEVIMENKIALLMTKQNISAAQIHASITERAELGEKIENIEKNYTFLMTKQNTLDDFITTIGIGLISRDCGEIYFKRGNGIYTIFPNSSSSRGFEVYCDFDTDNGKWTISIYLKLYHGQDKQFDTVCLAECFIIDRNKYTVHPVEVFQRRINGTTDFYRGWEEYENGFGNLETEFWLGNQKINELTSNGLNELRVEITDFDGNTGYAKYSTFSIGNVSTQYKLKVGGYSGNIGDSMKENNGMQFTTKDKDSDHWPFNCGERYKGAWWYRRCTFANLNGKYLEGGQDHWTGITWYNWTSSSYSMKSSVMMLRKAYPPG